ncbi:hypothetical protein EKO25_18425 [Bacillus sp. SAJ1]|nr:hypothetical protein EKO25_18425 [Bacillus sp. SAJ1]
MLVAFILLISLVMPMKSFANAAVYTISPTTAHFDKSMTKFTTYNNTPNSTMSLDPILKN